jgi:Ca2+-binding RTX toxin-like protein
MKTLAVIYNHNMPEITDSLWESLKPYERNDYDLILIDNGSRNDCKSRYTTHETGQNTYFGGALNIAMQFFIESIDKYDSLLSLNNDLILQGPNFVRTLRNEMFRGDYKIISPCVLQVNNQCKWKYMHCWNTNNTRDVKWVDFQAPLLHKDFILYMQQFPDKLIYGWGQDVLSGIICEQQRWKVGVVDKCPLIHHSAQTYKAGASDMDLTTYCRNAETNMFKYFEEQNLLNIFHQFRNLSLNYSYE